MTWRRADHQRQVGDPCGAAAQLGPRSRAGVPAPRFRFLLRRVWHQCYGQDRVVIFVGSLADSAGAPPPDGITFRSATAKDLLGLPSLSPQARRIQALLAEDECWLHVAHDGDRLVGYRFVTHGFWGHGVLANIVRLEADQVYVDDIVVHPDYRRHKIGHRLIASQDQDLLGFGFREYVAAVSADNVASLRLTLRARGRPVLFVDSIRRLLYYRRTVSPTMPPDIQRIVDEVRS